MPGLTPASSDAGPVLSGRARFLYRPILGSSPRMTGTGASRPGAHPRSRSWFPSAAAAKPSLADRISCFLTLAEELLMRHDWPPRMVGLKMRDVRVVVGHANHQPGGLYHHIADETGSPRDALGPAWHLSHRRPPSHRTPQFPPSCRAASATPSARPGCRKPPWSARSSRTVPPIRHRDSR